MVKPPYEGPLILAETRSIASEAFNFVQLLKVTTPLHVKSHRTYTCAVTTHVAHSLHHLRLLSISFRPLTSPLQEREKREQLQRTRNVLLEGIKKLSNKKST